MSTTTTPPTTATRKSGTPNRRVPVTSTQDFTQLGARWNSMTGIEKSTWFRLLQIANDNLQPNTPRLLTAYNTFIQASTAVTAYGGTPSNTAPDYENLPPLPGVLVNARLVGNALSIILAPTVAYANKCLVYGAKPQLAGQDVYEGTSFALCGALSSMPSSCDVSALFAKRFRMPTAGYQIALKLVGVSDGGLRTAPLFVTGIVGAPALSMTDGGGEEAPADDALPPYILRIA